MKVSMRKYKRLDVDELEDAQVEAVATYEDPDDWDLLEDDLENELEDGMFDGDLQVRIEDFYGRSLLDHLVTELAYAKSEQMEVDAYYRFMAMSLFKRTVVYYRLDILYYRLRYAVTVGWRLKLARWLAGDHWPVSYED